MYLIFAITHSTGFMAPSVSKAASKVANKEAKKATKEKVFHPQSRKAGQLERAQLRKHKLADASNKRGKNLVSKGEPKHNQASEHLNDTRPAADRYAFFFHALPPDVPSLTLPEIHEIIQTVWLVRHDSLLKDEQAQRRPGRPQSARELALLEMKLQDEEAYRTGLSKWQSPGKICTPTGPHDSSSRPDRPINRDPIPSMGIKVS